MNGNCLSFQQGSAEGEKKNPNTINELQITSKFHCAILAIVFLDCVISVNNQILVSNRK